MTQSAQWNNRDEYGYPTRPASRRKLRNFAVQTSKRILLATIYGAMSIAGAGLQVARASKDIQPLNTHHFHPKRILVIRMDLIGDLTLSLVVVRTLKWTYPEAEIDLLAIPSSASIATADPDLAEIISYNPNIWRRPQALFQGKNWREALALRRRLHARQYNLAISVFGPWAAILAVLSGAPRRLGFGKESYPGFMTDNVPGKHWDTHDHKHEVDYCLELARAAGATIEPDDRVPQLFVDPQASQQVEQLLQQKGWDANKPLIACHVSSNNGQSKRWPIPYWAKLIDRLIREYGANVVLTGAQVDLPLIERITQHMQEHPIVLAGKTSLPQLAALLQQADLLISGDSGPMHIGAAVGTPLIAIHGPTDPALSGPVSPKATILRSDIWCSPCYNAKGPADCRFFTTQCMKDITPDRVFSVVQEKLQDNGTHASVQTKDT
ncbi:ADP-heptose--LPS heptosyltransferase [Reticulibacter mediterranei]|uniref:lipopolysaccharide heptosyltransferase II n=1 Tax=Reticulibacter mediterranei TaxID=2778369 RepID=A0A8J3N2H3_9CHLR|nr:lipopolysaccharide heptosyltransferase II [Reticulibacter mediterranei]GHO95527.1 ADP-heptose--LPS heptosyltransferase [Reticulibacter mediterranei]